MGKRSRKHHKGVGHNRSLKRGVRDLKRTVKDLDQIYESLFKIKSTDSTPKDSLLHKKGKGDFYCQFCDRYFLDQQALLSHSREKFHKRRIKEINNYVPYNG